MDVENIIAGGCSFTANGIGGVPPTNNSTGGCSFIHAEADPQSWVGFLAKKLQVNSLVNLAVESHGNILTANSILELLRRYPYNPEKTLVVFNISDPARFDVPCSFDHPDRSKFIPWTKEIIPYSYFDRNTHSALVKSVGIEQVEQLTTNNLEFLFNFLENNHIHYYFTTLRDYSAHPILGPLIKSRITHYINIGPELGMYDYCCANNLIGPDGYHPSLLGHEVISQIVFDRINISATPGSSDVGIQTDA